MIDVKSANAHLDAVIRYLEHMRDRKDTCYQKTIDQISELSDKCNEALELIHDITGLSRSTISESSDTLSARIDNIEKQLSLLIESPEMSQHSETVKSPDTIIDSKSKKRDISNCGKLLARVAKTDFTCPQAQTCAELLHLWYDCRFFHLDKSVSSFKYNVLQISEWIQDIVIAYGKSVYSGKEVEFVSEFQHWCNSLSTSDGKDRKYPLPYCVFSVVKDCKSSDMTLTALVLWDMLLDVGLNELGPPNFSAIHISSEDLVVKCRSINKYLLALYEDYKVSDEVYTCSNLSRKEII